MFADNNIVVNHCWNLYHWRLVKSSIPRLFSCAFLKKLSFRQTIWTCRIPEQRATGRDSYVYGAHTIMLDGIYPRAYCLNVIFYVDEILRTSVTSCLPMIEYFLLV